MQTQEHGGDVYSAEYRLDFSTNINPGGTPQSVRRAVLTSVGELAQYPDPRCRDLKRALSEHLHLPAHWITCSNGAVELIYAVAHAVRPRAALLITPCFSEYLHALEAAGCPDIRACTCRREDRFAVGGKVLDLITQDVDLMYICNPVNPTGYRIPKKLLVQIAARCLETGTVLVADECYNAFTEEPEEASLLGYVQDNPNLIVVNAFTKLYAMPGLRLGYGITSDRALRDKVRGCIQPWSVSIPAQRAGIAALGEAAYVESSRRMIASERAYMMQLLERIGVTCYPSSANFLFFEGPADLYDLCAKKGMLIRDCSNMPGLKPGYFRVAVRTRRENEELMGLLADLTHTSGRYLPSYVE